MPLLDAFAALGTATVASTTGYGHPGHNHQHVHNHHLYYLNAEVAWRAKKSDARKADKAARRIARDTYYALLEQGMPCILYMNMMHLPYAHVHVMMYTCGVHSIGLNALFVRTFHRAPYIGVCLCLAINYIVCMFACCTDCISRSARQAQDCMCVHAGMDPDVALGQAQAGLKQQHAHSMASTLPAITDPPGADTGIPLAPGVPPGGPMGLAAMSATTAMSNTPISFGSSAASGGSSSSGGPAVALLFPGQGSQALGMLREASTLPAVQSMLSLAQGMLGYDLLEVCLNGEGLGQR